MLTLAAMPKPFDGLIAIAQNNAISSWTALPDVHTVLFAPNDMEYDPKPVLEVETNAVGTPLVNSIFQTLEREAVTDLVGYINADIILMADFYATLLFVLERIPGPFLMTGRRWDLDYHMILHTADPDWQTKLRAAVKANGTWHQPAGMDYFIYRKGTLDVGNWPPFALGRFRWDNWIMWKANQLGVQTIDASAAVMAVHQNHDYSHFKAEAKAELAENERLARETGCNRWCTTDDATHYIDEYGEVHRRE